MLSRARLIPPDIPLLRQHALYHALDRDAKARQAAHRELFRNALDTRVINAIPDLIHPGFSGKSTIIGATGV